MALVAVSDSFDDLRCLQVRFLEEAARLGPVHVLLWPDEMVERTSGRAPKLPQEERLYFVSSIRYVDRVTLVEGTFDESTLPHVQGFRPEMWAMMQGQDGPAVLSFCQATGIACRVISDEQLVGFPSPPPPPLTPGRKKVLVTGCYDWLHTGHVRFFEEVSEYGDLYVCVGHDANIVLLKGPGHPLFKQEQRRYMAWSIRYVTSALVTSGDGWLDAEPEIRLIRPDIYAVNEDGDKPEKKEYCEQHGIQYLVLKRLPKPGLPRRQSTILRGF